MSDRWHIVKLPDTDAIVAIKDENGLEVATCIAEDAPVMAAAPDLAESAADFLAWFEIFLGHDAANEVNCSEIIALRAAIAKASQKVD